MERIIKDSGDKRPGRLRRLLGQALGSNIDAQGEMIPVFEQAVESQAHELQAHEPRAGYFVSTEDGPKAVTDLRTEDFRVIFDRAAILYRQTYQD